MWVYKKYVNSLWIRLIGVKKKVFTVDKKQIGYRKDLIKIMKINKLNYMVGMVIQINYTQTKLIK